MATPKTRLLNALHAMITEARKASDHPNSAPHVRHAMLRGRFYRRIDNDIEIKRRLLSGGLDVEIRKYLKAIEEGVYEDRPGPDQLALWPEDKREIIKDIDRTRVFVPSRNEFVDLLPDEISHDECVEAGEYLIQKGEETVRVGRLVVRLGQAGW
jgi:hypothetical protein